VTIRLPEQYFLETGLYEVFKHADLEAMRALVAIQFYVGTLDAYCDSCSGQSVFQSTSTLPSVSPGAIVENPAGTVASLLKAGKAWLPHSDDEGASLSYQNVLEYSIRQKIFMNVFRCSRNIQHELRFITRVGNASYEKVGQFPSIADLLGGESARYRKVLGSDYSEYSRAVGLFAHGVGVGSFVYLRRIFERQISMAKASAATDAGWDEALFQSGRVDDRILLLRAWLPEFLVENRGLYSILSKGIHELSESECLEHFPVVRLGIDMILDERIAEIERREKVAKSQSAISTLVGKIRSGSS
jgi:hypothetical protein